MKTSTSVHTPNGRPKNRQGARLSRHALALFVLAISSVGAPAAIILSDDFSLNSTNREAGDPLSGVPVQTYNSSLYPSAPVWAASTNAVFASGGAITSATHAVSYSRVATPNQTAGTLSLSADVNLGGTTTAEWIGLSFAYNTSLGITDSNNSFLLLLRNSGTISLYKNGTTTLLYNQPWSSWNTTTPFNAATTYNLTLEYDRTAGEVDVFVNGVAIHATATVGALNQATFGSVGFQLQPLAGGSMAGISKVDNFLYTIPEPSTAALAGLSVFGIAYLRLRRNRSGK